MFLRGWSFFRRPSIPFVEKRLESSLKGHWQVQVVEKLPSLRPKQQWRDCGWDQAALLNAMDRFWSEAFKAGSRQRRAVDGQ